MKKIIIALILAFMIPASAFAYDFSKMSDNELHALIAQINEEIILRSKSDTDSILEGYAGKHYVSVDGLRLSKDQDGNSVIVLDMKFTNGSEQSEMPLTALTVNVFQNGIDIDRGYKIEDASYSNATKKLRPGATINFSYGFVLNNLTDPIEIEIDESFGFSDEMLYGMFNLPQ